eukprot:TRINITY_DN23169_c0_g1_i3.p1 TRINITY_DN23169_c0_g1~~TRINITY_DN23169_c0_g1_i3.p1  ORF type:complete len:145 (+),score=41.31 TRINITY_DN23169_c0_g1_i3:157-591(+)
MCIRDRLSQCSVHVPEELRGELTTKIQEAGTTVVEAKEGKGSATLSMAVAAARFAEEVMKGLSGDGVGRACAYVDAGSMKSSVMFFADVCKYDEGGIVLGDPTPRDDAEKAAIDAMMQDLIQNHATASAFLAWHTHLAMAGALQ